MIRNHHDLSTICALYAGAGWATNYVIMLIHSDLRSVRRCVCCGCARADVPHRVGGPVARLAADPGRERLHRLQHLPLHVQLHHHRLLGAVMCVHVILKQVIKRTYRRGA